jgi:hypothetical protein
MRYPHLPFGRRCLWTAVSVVVAAAATITATSVS